MDPSLEEYIRLRVNNIINNIKESIERLSELWIYYQEFGGRDVEFLDYLETHHLAYANAVNNYELFLCFHNCGRNVEDHMTLFFSLMSYFEDPSNCNIGLDQLLSIPPDSFNPLVLLQPEYCPILSNEAYSMFLADLAEFCQDYKIPDTKRSILSQIFIREVHRSYQLLPPGVISDEVLLKKWRSEIESRIKARMKNKRKGEYSTLSKTLMNMPHRSERMSVKKFMNEFENKQLKEIPKMNNVDIGTVPLNDSSAIAIVPNDDVQTDGKISKVVPNECMVVNTSVSVPKNIDKIVPTEREQRMIFYDVSDESSDETYEDIKPKAVNVKEIKKLNIKRTKKALAALKKKRESKKKQCDCFL